MASAPPPSPHDRDAADRLGRVTLEEKVRLLTGATSFTLHPLPSIGLRRLVMSDGPAGVRGPDGSGTSASFPAPTALAATWDEDTAARVGVLFAREARRHGVDVVLAPVVNLHRTPVGGRHFECLSEDPLLTARLAAALITALQARGVGAAVKHYVANDSETARTEYIARIDERTLREVYLAPFEHAVAEAGAWSVMAAYNGVDDGVESATATEHRHLITDVLKGEWGFDGVVVSDWLAARSTEESANAGLDLVMPGPGGPWEDGLLAAVRAGRVGEDQIDDKAARILRLARRVGALDGARSAADPADTADLPDTRTVLRDLAAASTVVLKDDPGLIPVAAGALGSVALIGPNAVDAFTQGGGSAFVHPDHNITPLEGLRAALPAGVDVTLHRGGDARPFPPALDVKTRAADPVDGTAGLRLDLYDEDGGLVDSRVLPDWTGRYEVPDGVTAGRIRTRVTLKEPGRHRLELGTVGGHRFGVDGRTVAAADGRVGPEVILDSSVNAPAGEGLDLDVDQPRTVDVEADLNVVEGGPYGRFLRAALRHRLPGPTADEEIAAAVDAARRADLAVLVLGTNDEVESEGWDRPGLALPGRQDELAARVLAAAERTVVVVNAGAPVLLPWLPDATTVLWTWFPGQECGHALADVLFGRTEPAGRLPWTLPARLEDSPVPHAVPGADLVNDYREGVHVGYRGWLRGTAAPALPFGHGLGWTTWDYTAVAAAPDTAGGATVDVTVRNTGPRAGREVVQAYLETAEPGPDPHDRPVRWLAGFGTVRAAAGDTATLRLRLAPRAFQIWDAGGHRWATPAGRYRLRVGRSATDLRLDAHITRT